MGHRAVWLSLLLVTLPAYAEMILPRTAAVPGGIAVVPLATDTHSAPRVHLSGERVMVVRHAGRWHAIVGLPLTTTPGVQQLTIVDDANQAKTHDIVVTLKDYRTQHIRLKNQRLVDPSAEDLARIEREQRILQAAFAHWRDAATPDMRFDLPARGRVSGNFGLKRIFNGAPRQPHSGIDIAAPRGTPVTAPADAVVIEIGDYFFNGRTVFLDHGQGLISMYNHLHRVRVKPGDVVKRGQRIGDIGATGRATGPHLHWAVSLNSARVDPLLFVSDAVLAELATGQP